VKKGQRRFRFGSAGKKSGPQNKGRVIDLDDCHACIGEHALVDAVETQNLVVLVLDEARPRQSGGSNVPAVCLRV
jgi:hypothetical protein